MPSDDGVRLALLSESQATLRQVRGVLNDFAALPDSSIFDAGETEDEASPVAVTALARLVTLAHSEISDVIEELRRKRLVIERGEGTDRRETVDALIDLEERMVGLRGLFVVTRASSHAHPAE